MKVIDKEEDYKFRCTEIDFWVDYEAVKSTVKNLVTSIKRAKKYSGLIKKRKPKIKKTPKNPKKSK